MRHSSLRPEPRPRSGTGWQRGRSRFMTPSGSGLVRLELPSVQLGIEPAFREQFVVGAFLDNPPLG